MAAHAGQVGARQRARGQSAQVGPRVGRAVLYAIAVVLGLILLIPFVWAVDSSLKPVEEIRMLPPEFWPSKVMWSNYPAVFTTKQFPFWVRNTFFITVLATAGTLITVAIIAFIANYNSFLFPLIILNSPEKFTLSIGIRSFSISATQDAKPLDHILLAMSVMMTLPILLMFFLGQRYFVRGVVMSGIKG